MSADLVVVVRCLRECLMGWKSARLRESCDFGRVRDFVNFLCRAEAAKSILRLLTFTLDKCTTRSGKQKCRLV